MGILYSKPDSGDCAPEENEMKYSIETVDSMAFSKVKRELFKYGFIAEDLCRAKLKECIEQKLEPIPLTDEGQLSKSFLRSLIWL